MLTLSCLAISWPSSSCLHALSRCPVIGWLNVALLSSGTGAYGGFKAHLLPECPQQTRGTLCNPPFIGVYRASSLAALNCPYRCSLSSDAAGCFHRLLSIHRCCHALSAVDSVFQLFFTTVNLWGAFYSSERKRKFYFWNIAPSEGFAEKSDSAGSRAVRWSAQNKTKLQIFCQSCINTRNVPNQKLLNKTRLNNKKIEVCEVLQWAVSSITYSHIPYAFPFISMGLKCYVKMLKISGFFLPHACMLG